MSKAKPIESAPEFWEALAKSGLLASDRLAEIRDKSAGLTTAQEVARQLIRQNLLTKWQAGQLLVGSTVFSFAGYRLCDLVRKHDLAREFLAEDDTFGRNLSLWLISPRFAKAREFVTGLAERMQQLLPFQHPHWVAWAAGRAEVDRCFIVHRLPNRRDLRSLVAERGPFPESQVRYYLRQAAAVLVALHERGIVHGDVRPDHLYVDGEGQLALRDVAGHLARSAAAPPEQPCDDDLAAWADYVSPEELTGTSIDPRADQYGLGCSACFLLTGSPPVAGTMQERREAHRQGQLSGIDQISDSMRSLLIKLVASDPAERWSSMAEFQAALDEEKTLSSMRQNLENESERDAEPVGQVSAGLAATRDAPGKERSVGSAVEGATVAAEGATVAAEESASDNDDEDSGYSFVVVRKGKRTPEVPTGAAATVPEAKPAAPVVNRTPIAASSAQDVPAAHERREVVPIAAAAKPAFVPVAAVVPETQETSGRDAAEEDPDDSDAEFKIRKRRREGDKRSATTAKTVVPAASTPEATELPIRKRFSPQVVMVGAAAGGSLLIIAVILAVVFTRGGAKGDAVAIGTPPANMANSSTTASAAVVSTTSVVAPSTDTAASSLAPAPGLAGAASSSTLPGLTFPASPVAGAPAAGPEKKGDASAEVKGAPAAFGIGNSSSAGNSNSGGGLTTPAGATTSAPATATKGSGFGSPVPPATAAESLPPGSPTTDSKTETPSGNSIPAAPSGAGTPPAPAAPAATATTTTATAAAATPSSPAPPAASPAPAPPAAKPFRDLPTAVRLPSVESGEDEVATLGAIHLGESDLCFIRLKGADRALKGKLHWGMANAQSGTAERDWEITLGDENHPTVVALLSAREQKLAFHWTADASKVPGIESLRNCVLALSVGAEKHDLALRTPDKVAPWSVNLEKEQNREKYTVEHGPPPDSVRIEFTGVVGLPKIVTDPASPAEVVKGGQWIWFAEREADAVLGLRVEVNYAGRTLNLNATPHFKLAADPKPIKMNSANVRAVKLQLAQVPQFKQNFERMKQANKDNPLLPNEEQRIKAMETAEAQIKKIEEQYTALKSGCQVQFRLVHDAEDQKVVILSTGP